MITRNYLSNLSVVAKAQWRYFVFAWIFPLYWFGKTMVIAMREQAVTVRASMWWFFIDLLVFLILGWIATTPLRRHAITISQAAVWLIVAPLVILFALALLPLPHPLHMEILTSGTAVK